MSSKAEERWKRLAAMGAKGEIPTPEGEARMSAVILEVAEPLFKQYAETPERAKTVIMLVVFGWNKSLFPPDKQAVVEKEIVDQLVPQLLILVMAFPTEIAHRRSLAHHFHDRMGRGGNG